MLVWYLIPNHLGHCRLVPYLSHGLYIDFGPESQYGLHFCFFGLKERNEVWLIFGFWKESVAMWFLWFLEKTWKMWLKMGFFSKSARCTLNSIFQKLENIGCYLYKLDYICLPDLFSLLCDVVMDKLDCCAQRPNKHSITQHIWSKEIKWKMDAVGKQGFISNH